MWALQNTTPFAAGRTWSRDINGWHQWIVAVKATYRFNDRGDIALADEQPEPVLAPEYLVSPACPACNTMPIWYRQNHPPTSS